MPGLRSTPAIALAFCVLTAVVTYPQAAHFSTSIANHPDPYFSIWRLGWVAHQLAADPRHLFDANIFYPERNTFAYSDAMLLPATILAPLFWLHVPPAAIYNAALLGALALSGVTMFLLARQVTGSMAGAMAAGAIYAFAPYRFEQYIHLEMQMVFWIPLALLLLHRVVAGRRLRDGIAFGLTLAAQMLSGIYGALYLFICLLVFTPALAVAAGVRNPGRLLKPLAAAGLVAAALIVPYARPYADAAATAGPRGTGEIRHYGASLASYAAAPPDNRLYGAATARFGGEELHLLPGLTALALAAVGLADAVRRRTRLPLAYVVLLVFAFDASRGLDGYVYPALYRYLPAMRALRVPSRFALFVNLSVAMLAAFGLAALLRSRARAARAWIASAAVALLVVEYASSPMLVAVPRFSLADRWLAGQPPGVVAELPLPRPEAMWPNDESLFMYHGMAHWRPMVNGYSGFFPASYLRLVRVMQTFPDESSIAYLRERGVSYLLVRPSFYDEERWQQVRDRLERPGGLRLLAGFPEPGRELIYAIPPAAAPDAIGSRQP